MMQKLGILASLLIAPALLISGFIYLTGSLEKPLGPLTYSVADLLAGPVLGASLVTMILALRERIGAKASRRMELGVLAVILASTAFVSVALIRSANRAYYLDHPGFNMETFLGVWSTIVAGLIGTGWHFLGWAFVLTGSAGWTSRRLPRFLSGLYFFTGVVSVFTYLLPDEEGTAGFFLLVISVWTAVLLWRAKPSKRR